MKRFFHTALILLAFMVRGESNVLLPAAETKTNPGRLDPSLSHEVQNALDRGREWLAGRQNPNGSWGVPPEIETTALARMVFGSDPNRRRSGPLRTRSAAWLAQQTPETMTLRETALTAWSLLWPPDFSEEPTAVRPFLERVTIRLSSVTEPITAAYSLIALPLAASQNKPRKEMLGILSPNLQSFLLGADPTSDIFSDIKTLAAGLIILSSPPSAGEPSRVPTLLNRLASHPGLFSPLHTLADYERLFLCSLAFSMHRTHRIEEPSGLLSPWRPRVARLLINAQRITPDGTLYWKTREEGQEDHASALALLTLLLLGAE